MFIILLNSIQLSMNKYFLHNLNENVLCKHIWLSLIVQWNIHLSHILVYLKGILYCVKWLLTDLKSTTIFPSSISVWVKIDKSFQNSNDINVKLSSPISRVYYLPSAYIECIKENSVKPLNNKVQIILIENQMLKIL